MRAIISTLIWWDYLDVIIVTEPIIDPAEVFQFTAKSFQKQSTSLILADLSGLRLKITSSPNTQRTKSEEYKGAAFSYAKERVRLDRKETPRQLLP